MINSVSTILVMGMHHSGTSLLAGALLHPTMMNMSGSGDHGALLMQKVSEQDKQKGRLPKKWYERSDFIHLGESLLVPQERDGDPWHTGFGFRYSAVAPSLRPVLQARASRIIERMEGEVRERGPGGLPLWVVKEPRMAITMPLWRPLLQPAKTVCVWIYRHPAAVAGALINHWAKNRVYSEAQWMGLWEKYTVGAIRGCRGMPLLLVSHQELGRNPVETMNRLIDELQPLVQPQLPYLTKKQVDSLFYGGFFKPDLDEMHASPYQLALYEALVARNRTRLDELTEGGRWDDDVTPELDVAVTRKRSVERRSLLAVDDSDDDASTKVAEHEVPVPDQLHYRVVDSVFPTEEQVNAVTDATRTAPLLADVDPATLARQANDSIVVYGTGSARPLVANAVASATAAGAPVVVVALDDGLAVCDGLPVPCYSFTGLPLASAGWSQWSPHLTGEYRTVLRLKISLVNWLLGHGLSFWLADADTAFLQNPLPYALAAAASDRDAVVFTSDPRVARPEETAGDLNAGNFYVTPRAGCALFARISDDLRDDPNLDDQTALQRATPRSILLDPLQFANGDVYFAPHRLPQRLNVSVVLVHANAGSAAKQARLRAESLWFVGDE